MQEQYGGEGGFGEDGYAAGGTLDYGAGAPAVVDADYTMPAAPEAQFGDAGVGAAAAGMDYAAPTGDTFAAGY